MRKYIFLVFMMMCVGSIAAQNHFIYLQSETNKPFTVTVKDKRFSSTASGYVIIPKLKAGTHELLVRLNDETADTRFSATIDKKDIGLTVRGLSGSNVSLVDMQTFSSIAPVAADAIAKNDKSTSLNNGEQPSNKAEVPKEDKPDAKPAIVKLKKGVNKISEMKENAGISLRFIDVQSKVTDTIDIIIPVRKPENQSSFHRKDDLLFRWASYETGDEVQDGYNTKCVHLVTKEDYARLRKKMAAQTDANKMVAEAVRVAKNKCLETQQVKNLSSLFSKESGKFKLVEALHPYVYNYLEYSALESLFSDSDYKTKFRDFLDSK